MYALNTYIDESYEMYTFLDTDSKSWLTVCPGRGGLITSFGLKGVELLYLNKDTLHDESKEIRGGIPVLFPVCGQLTDQRYHWKGHTYFMPIHGLALNRLWRVVEAECDDAAAWITLSFSSDSETKKAYPFDFELLFTYTLCKDKLTIKQVYRNHSPEPMPFYAGFHPYFKTEKKSFSVNSDATMYLDYNDLKMKKFTGSVNMTGVKKAFVLPDGGNKSIITNLFSSQGILIETSSAFKYWVLWTQPNDDFVCVEPWMADRDELNRKEELAMVGANSQMEEFVEIKLKDY
ncbi:aldose epimerase [Radiobacillus sp. PE A8.2]|uniref:aldose epimerase family protein n=1 Tax=Radiobacillus sp. PE A8.2 TaxID=3380349 RepID=UPI00388F7A54